MEHLGQVASIVGSLTVIIGAIFAFKRWIVPVIANMLKSFAQIASIKDQFYPNGGSSMRDQIDKLLVHTEKAALAHVEIKKEVAALSTSVETMASRQWALVATQSAPVFETDENGECIRANVAYLNLVERDFEQLRGFGWELCIDASDRAMVSREWQEAVSKDRSMELGFKIKGASSGRLYSVKCIASPYHDHNGNVLGYLGRYVSVEELQSKAA
jgi:PAS domain-containing protein